MDTSSHNAIAAAFSDGEIAQACYEALDRGGFPHRWMAITKPAEAEAWGGGSPEATSENDIVEPGDGALAASGRFFSGEGNSLRRSLEDHGIDTVEAIAIDETLHLGGAVVVVAAHDRRDAAASILRQGGGRFYRSLAQPSGAYDVATDTFATATLAPPSTVAAAPCDAERTLESRRERLEIVKERVPAAVATVGTRVASEAVSFEDPSAHDELDVEDETIRVPLRREGVVVGQRRAEGVERASETLLHEELEVNEASRVRAVTE